MSDDEAQLQALAHNLKRARLHANLTQMELSDAAGLSRTSITNLETARQNITLATLWKLARILHVTPCDLMGGWEF